MRIAFLWTLLSGYMNACLKELAGREGVELFVSHGTPTRSAPFDENQFAWIADRFVWRSSPAYDLLAPRLDAFAPDILVLSGWHVPAYRRISRALANDCWRVMCMDNCWLATIKQRAGAWIAPVFLWPLADTVWIPGERQAVFARRMGFSQRAILRGLYSCDQPVIAAAHQARLARGRLVPRQFLFVGRFIPEKGVDTLIKAYEAYRKAAVDPWPLVCCGAGPLQSQLEGKAGIRVEGFVQPQCLPAMLASAGCLVLPSRFEPWAVVVHEAASAGLLILASEMVGATAHLVQSNFNGFIFGRGDAEGLANLLLRVSAFSDKRLDAMSRASHLLSQQYSPTRWADTLLQSFPALLRHAPANADTHVQSR